MVIDQVTAWTETGISEVKVRTWIRVYLFVYSQQSAPGGAV